MSIPEGKEWTRGELLAFTLARELRDGDVAVMGAVSMLPVAACHLARRTHAPNLSFIVGGSGAVNPRFGSLAQSSCDFSLLEAEAVIPLPEVILLEGRPRFDVFFAGGLQIDRYGNCNLVCVGGWEDPKLRGPGTVGLPYLTRAGRTIIYTLSHSPRTFVEKVDFNSGPGFLDGPASWRAQRLPGNGPAAVVTDLCTMDFDEETLSMRLRTVHPGITVDQVLASTGFDLVVPSHVPETPAPDVGVLQILREIDPEGMLRVLFPDERVKK